MQVFVQAEWNCRYRLNETLPTLEFILQFWPYPFPASLLHIFLYHNNASPDESWLKLSVCIRPLLTTTMTLDLPTASAGASWRAALH